MEAAATCLVTAPCAEERCSRKFLSPCTGIDMHALKFCRSAEEVEEEAMHMLSIYLLFLAFVDFCIDLSPQPYHVVQQRYGAGQVAPKTQGRCVPH